MDPYDGIIEQLKQARQSGLETVAGRLDAVKAKLDALVQEVRSAIDEAAPQDPDELLPIAQAEAALAEAAKHVQLGQTDEGSGAPAAGDGLLTLELLRRLDTARSQSELLREMLTVMSSMVERAAVLVVREGAISAWSGIGFADPEQLRQWRGAVTASSMLQQFVTDLVPVRFAPQSDPLFSEWLPAAEMPAAAMVIPVCLRGKLVGAIYLDHGSNQTFNEEQAQIMVAMICWLIDTLATRQERSTPMLAEPVGLPAAASAAPQAPQAEAPLEAPVEPAASELAEGGVSAAAEFDPSATIRVDMAQMASMANAGEAQAAEPAEAAPPQAGEVAEAAAAAPEGGGGDSRHEEARRFARLLVSEIKLYNEEEVDRGRANGDLYQRLKEDIDRSREMFEKRIPPEVRTSQDYFKEELIRILADGNAEVLGM